MSKSSTLPTTLDPKVPLYDSDRGNAGDATLNRLVKMHKTPFVTLSDVQQSKSIERSGTVQAQAGDDDPKNIWEVENAVHRVDTKQYQTGIRHSEE